MKTRIGTDFSPEYRLSCDKYAEMRKNHTDFMEPQSAKVKGRDSVITQVSENIKTIQLIMIQQQSCIIKN